MQHVYTFESLGEFLTAVDVPKPHSVASDTAWSHYYTEWCGGTREEAFDKARNGWAEGRANMVEAMAKARPAVSLPPAFTRSGCGGCWRSRLHGIVRPRRSAAQAYRADCRQCLGVICL